jgi:hypothetical protein
LICDRGEICHGFILARIKVISKRAGAGFLRSV